MIVERTEQKNRFVSALLHGAAFDFASMCGETFFFFIDKFHTPLPRTYGAELHAAIVHNARTPGEWLLCLVEGSMRWPLLLVAVTPPLRGRAAAWRDGGRYKNNC